MNFFTPVDIPKSNISIDYNTRLMFVGSCFAENISRFFCDAKFKCFVNPTGIVYNPISMQNMFFNVVRQKKYTAQDFFFDGTKYLCYDFHSSFGYSTIDESVYYANNSIAQAFEFLKTANIVFITLGTAFVYYLASDTSRAVSNCHKQHPSTFVRRLVAVDEVSEALSSIVEQLLEVNKDLKFVFTVSPIRHWKDGAHGNRLSKSTLHLGIEPVLAKYNCCEYFPSCEIIEDELRDYRFYADDMLHPSPLSEKIIWQRIRDTYINKVCDTQISRVEKFMQAVHHRIVDTSSPATVAFCKKNLLLADVLESDIHGLDLTEEKKYFKTFI